MLLAVLLKGPLEGEMGQSSESSSQKVTVNSLKLRYNEFLIKSSVFGLEVRGIQPVADHVGVQLQNQRIC